MKLNRIFVGFVAMIALVMIGCSSTSNAGRGSGNSWTPFPGVPAYGVLPDSPGSSREGRPNRQTPRISYEYTLVEQNLGGDFVLRVPLAALTQYYDETELETLRLVGGFTNNWDYSASHIGSRFDGDYVFFHDIPRQAVLQCQDALITSHYEREWFLFTEGRKSAREHDNDCLQRTDR